MAYKWVNLDGKTRRAITVNNQIPGPILHFKQGDHVIINVQNLLDVPTTIHWHGVLVPWQMDGVEGVSQEGIKRTFQYRFTLYQSGTYWYHAHADLQEQDGLYGAFIIDPIKKPAYHYTKDFAIVLSDWSHSTGKQIFANLKKDGDYYSPRFPLQPSLMKFLHDYSCVDLAEKKLLLNDYKTMQKMRMSIYDISDVAYNSFLMNGHSACYPWEAAVKINDVVRLRFIDASGSTNFFVKIPGTTMQVVHVQGNDVKPYLVNNFFITPGETIDVLLKIKDHCPYVIYAESADKVGAAYGALISDLNQMVNFHVTPFPEPKPVTREMMHNMMTSEDHHGHMQHQMQQMHHMNMPTEATIIGDKFLPPNSFNAKTSGTKYQNLIAAVKTNNPHKRVDAIIRMELFGYMDRYIWFINGLPEYRAHPIIIEPAKRYRIIFTNISMMHHPMHIHGHWFILRNGHGEYDPLLHTIDVPPGATVVADIDGDASGQWFFHCHHIYHMAAGMARVFQYSTIIDVLNCNKNPENFVAINNYKNRPIVRVDQTPINFNLIAHPMAHSAGFYLANFLDVGEDPYHDVQEITFKGLYGPDYHKLELFTNDAEIEKGTTTNADIDIFYWHLISQFWAIKGGANYFYRPSERPYWQPGVGIEGLMPYFIDTDVRTYFHNGSFKFDAELERDTQITNNFYIRPGIRSIIATKTVTADQVGSGLNQMRYTLRPFYWIMPGLNIFVEYEHDQDYGAFKSLQRQQGEDTKEDTVTLGLSAVL